MKQNSIAGELGIVVKNGFFVGCRDQRTPTEDRKRDVTKKKRRSKENKRRTAHERRGNIFHALKKIEERGQRRRVSITLVIGHWRERCEGGEGENSV